MSDPVHDMSEIPADLRAIDARVAHLLEVEREGAPAGISDRLFEATRGVVTRGVRPVPRRRGDRLVHGERGTRGARLLPMRVFTPMRLAAAVGILGAVVAVRLATVAPSPSRTDDAATASLEAEIDSMLAASDFLDDGLGELGQGIDLIFADVLSVDRSMQGEDEWLEGGAL